MSPPPSVLFLIHDLCHGGAERVFADHVRRLRSVRPIPVLVRRTIELQDVEANAVLDLGGPGRQDLPWPLAGASILIKAARLRRLARSSGARVISSFLHKSHLIALFARLVLDRDLRVVVNVHELQSDHLKHHFAGARAVLMRRLLSALLPRADLLIVPVRGIADDLVNHFNVSRERIAVVPNAIDAPHIRARAVELPHAAFAHLVSNDDGTPLIVSIGRLVPLKGHADLLRAFARLRRDTAARLLIVGDGPERARLERLAATLGVADTVHFTGFLENPWTLLAHADVCVLPSHTEAFPNVIGEALALGVPVVATRCSPGVEGYLGGGACGLLVPPRDPAALAEGVRRVLDDPALGRSFTERGYERVAALDPDAVTAAYEAALARVCQP